MIDPATPAEMIDFLQAQGEVDVEVVRHRIAMDKKTKYIAQNHHSKITQSEKDRRWRTYVKVEGKNKLVAKSRKEDLIEYLYRFYSGAEQDANPDFESLFSRFMSYKEATVSQNTVDKYNHDYKRFFKDTPLESRVVSSFTFEMLQDFIVARIKELRLNNKAYQAMFDYLNQALNYAVRVKIIEDNPMKYLERKDYLRHCVDSSRTNDERIASNAEIGKVLDVLRKDYREKPEYIPSYAVELSMLTGMRRGELSSLKWSDVCKSHDGGEVLKIRSQEVQDRIHKKYVITQTKNGKIREIPVTPYIKNLLDRVREIERKQGWLTDYVFSDKNGRVHGTTIGNCAQRKSKQAKIKNLGLHAYRRTINSLLKNAGVSTTVAASMLGHSDYVNYNNYTFDVSGMEYKRMMLARVQSFDTIASDQSFLDCNKKSNKSA